ncbi:hypothetical protein CR513_54984, partial [Mucuna pruriens]
MFVIKLFKKNIRYPIVVSKLKAMWKLQQGFDLRDIGHSYFIIKFDSREYVEGYEQVCFLRTDMMFYGESFILGLAYLFGKPVKVVINTLHINH